MSNTYNTRESGRLDSINTVQYKNRLEEGTHVMHIIKKYQGYLMNMFLITLLFSVMLVQKFSCLNFHAKWCSLALNWIFSS